MRFALLIASAGLIAPVALSDPKAPVYGLWGTAQQCAREPIKEGGTVFWEPFEINDEWLRQGKLWCQLSWFPVEPRPDGVFTGAFARCGEDAVIAYLLGMELIGEELTLTWDAFRSNGPLRRCE